MTIFGLDVSGFQDINLTPLTNQSYELFISKLTEGKGFADSTYAGNLAEVQRNGGLFAAYDFVHSDSTAAEQADNIAAHILDKTIPVMLDCEPSGASRPTLKMCEDIRTELHKRGIHVSLLYFPHWYWLQQGSPSLKGWNLWQSEYPGVAHDYGAKLYRVAGGDSGEGWAPQGGVIPGLWQFTSAGKVDGFPGKLDLDAYRGTRAQLAATGWFKDFAAKPAPAPAPAPTPKPAPAPAPKPAPTPTPAPRPAPAPAPRPAPASAPLSFNVALFPGKSTPDMPRNFVEEDGVLLASHLGNSSVAGITEATLSDAADFGKAFPHHTPLDYAVECPVWVGSDWVVTGHWVLPLHGGLATVSPSREASVATAIHHGAADRLKTALVFTHLVSGAWNGRVDPSEQWRKDEWAIAYAKIQAEVTRLIGLGFTVILAGDMNTGVEKRGSTLSFAANQIHAYDSTLDHMWICPAAGVKVSAATPVILHGHSDHPAAIVAVTLS